MERITFKTITDTGGTEPKDSAAGALNQGFASGMQAAQNAEENENEENENEENGSEDNGNKDTGGDADVEFEAAGSWKDGKTFGETKIGEGLGKIGKFVKFWKKE
tara:strand:+ start:291 stop:605 length:315 start_codon:yes stop_codon:yes gene_type:complete